GIVWKPNQPEHSMWIWITGSPIETFTVTRADVVQLQPRTGVKEVVSDLHEGAMVMHPIGPYVLSLVDPSINVDVPRAARTVDRMPAHVDLGEDSVKVRDAVRLGVLAVEPRPRQKLMDEERPTRLPRAGAGNDVATRYGKGRDATARSRDRENLHVG